MMNVAALIVAAGTGERARASGNRDIPKQYQILAGVPVLRITVAAFVRHPLVGATAVVIRNEDRSLYDGSVKGLELLSPVTGGSTRQESVRLGLEALCALGPRHVLIHDAARPLVSAAAIRNVIEALGGAEAAAPMLAVADTLRRKGREGYEIVSRDELYRTQTPQGFHYDAILEAHRRFANETVTDDVALAARAGLSFIAIPGDDMNIKLTNAGDFTLAERLTGHAARHIRTGTGFDVHPLVPGDHVWLCGIKISHDKGLAGHSDADAGLHALTDAILGALGAGDIGMHFPPSDPRWRGAASDIFLAHAVSLVTAQNGMIANVDVTLICERPKIAPYRDAMRARIADILHIDIGRISVKATTTEGLGYTGRGEGIAAQAVATLSLPA